MARQEELLLKASAALDDGVDPFHVEWLSEHGVTLDECYSLSEQLALGALLLVNVLRELRMGGLPATVGAGDHGWDTNHVFDDECEGRTFTVIWSDPDEDEADAD